MVAPRRRGKGGCAWTPARERLRPRAELCMTRRWKVMALRDIIPWTRKGNGNGRSLVRRGEAWDPIARLQREFNDLFEDFFDTPFWAPWREQSFMPRVEVEDTDDELVVKAELPGIDEKDLTVELQDGALTISGEKKSQSQEEKRGYVRSEFSYGRFDRVIPLDPDIDADRANAQFRRGVLTVRLPRKPEARANRRVIPVQS
jgi:HSP20 family protein